MLEMKTDHNLECHVISHNRHLCYLVSQGFDLSDRDDYKALVTEPKYKCGHCGRLANPDDHLEWC